MQMCAAVCLVESRGLQPRATVGYRRWVGASIFTWIGMHSTQQLACEQVFELTSTACSHSCGA
eukprot:171189-Pelagomonas_calceolata.AAC.2